MKSLSNHDTRHSLRESELFHNQQSSINEMIERNTEIATKFNYIRILFCRMPLIFIINFVFLKSFPIE
ncbi:MAG: hypothetical protein M2R45_02806 [Verrucomicrobia subdivision 3 bacterium]|nr:hypothetical protein [Limisphaerales bacterium]MCS1414358.1 hypothetical protein [Limisphaerales bacterium]